MQDRLKFRIWHETLKQMHYNDFIVTATGYIAKLYQENDYMMKFNQEDLEFDKQCVVMQCTGLKDKNGKLIYEGDICKYKFEEIGEQKAIIYFKKELCSFLSKPLNDFQYTRINNCEVIGNIYENKELLNEI